MEDEILPSLTEQPIFYYRYVDDIIMATKTTHINEVVQVFNNFNNNLKFTVELENNSKIPFLDTMIIINENRSLIFDLYRKPTWSGRYLNYHSSLPHAYKINTISILAEKIIKISHKKFHTKNFNFLTQTLVENNYPKSLIQQIIKKTIIKINNNTVVSNQQLQPSHYISLPYKKDLFEKLKNCLKKYNITAAGKADNDLKKYLRLGIKDKTPLELESENIYKLDCSCQKTYIGETNQYLKKRMYQHKYNIKIQNKSHSGVAEHIINNPSHIIDFDNVKILDKEKNATKRKIKECIYIGKYTNNINNHIHTKQIDNIYLPLLYRD